MLTPHAVGVLRLTAIILATVLMALSTIWGAFALWYQVPGGQGMKALCLLLWALVGLATSIALWQDRMAVGLIVFALAFGGLLLWWSRISPSNDRLCADDVAQMTAGTVDGHRVTLHNVRNFDWRTNTAYTQRWETRNYDLDNLP